MPVMREKANKMLNGRTVFRRNIHHLGLYSAEIYLPLCIVQHFQQNTIANAFGSVYHMLN